MTQWKMCQMTHIVRLFPMHSQWNMMMFPGSVHLRHLGSPPESPGIFWDPLGPRFQFLAEKRQWFCQDPSAEGNWEDGSRRSRSAELWAPGSWDPKKNKWWKTTWKVKINQINGNGKTDEMDMKIMKNHIESLWGTTWGAAEWQSPDLTWKFLVFWETELCGSGSSMISTKHLGFRHISIYFAFTFCIVVTKHSQLSFCWSHHIIWVYLSHIPQIGWSRPWFRLFSLQQPKVAMANAHFFYTHSRLFREKKALKHVFFPFAVTPTCLDPAGGYSCGCRGLREAPGRVKSGHKWLVACLVQSLHLDW